MKTLTCHFARMDGNLPVPNSWRDLKEIKDVFEQSSNNSIRVVVRDERIDNALDFPGPSHRAVQLHQATHALTQNEDHENVKAVDHVAILLCRRYDPKPDLFGLMFDEGFVKGLGYVNNDKYNYAPREGCAIFFDRIKEERSGLTDRFDDQILFTTIHEMGHLFNLQHLNDKKNFLSQSDKKTFPRCSFVFTRAHRKALERAPVDEAIWPGGNDFEVGGIPGDIGVRTRGRTCRQMPFGLDMRIEMARRSMARYDPIELDIEIFVAPGVGRKFRVPDMFDSGYETFRIWIEEPSGERRFLRSPRHYCRQRSMFTVSARHPFRRDVSIYGESGGYTFRSSGVHRVWVDCDIGADRRLVSNTLEIEIRPRWLESDSDSERDRGCLFTSRAGQTLFYHREIEEYGKTAKLFQDFLDSYPGDPAAGSIRYSLGRAALKRTDRSERHRKSKQWNDVKDLLELAIQDRFLGIRQREIAIDLCAARDPRPRRRRS